MEVWGGNRAADAGVVMPGLDVWVYSLPYLEVHRAGEGDRAGDDARAGTSAGDAPRPPGAGGSLAPATVVDDRVGGDVHFVSSCGTGRIARMMVADVSGHGPSASSVAIGLRTLMRRFVNYLDQTAFVEALNRSFGEADQGGRFATSVAMTFFAPTARLDVCNAGHPRPLLRRAGSGSWEFLDPSCLAPRGRRGAAAPSDDGGITNLPLGILEPTRYEQFGLELARGDLVLVYTDALVEARAPSGELLGEEGLRRILDGLAAPDPAALIPAILAAIEGWRAGAPPDDDVTLLLLRSNGSARQAPILRRLAASVRFLGILLRNCVPVGERPPIPWPEPRLENIVGAAIPRVARRWRAGRI